MVQKFSDPSRDIASFTCRNCTGISSQVKLLRALLQEVNSGYQINRWVTVEVIRLEMIQCFKSKGEPSEDLRVMIRKQFAESYLDSIPTNWIELACSTIGRVSQTGLIVRWRTPYKTE